MKKLLYVVFYFYRISTTLIDIATKEIESMYDVKKNFVGVIDAGTTGTRLNIFGFLEPGNIIANYISIKSYPGLHTLKNKEIKAVINYLLTNGEKRLKYHGVKLKDVVFAFKGTAGMRKITKKKQEQILNIISKHFETKKLTLKHPEVISGLREGFLSFTSLSMLIDYKNNILTEFGCKNKKLRRYITNLVPEFCLIEASKSKYKGILDMGGGSIQVAYEFSKKDKFDDSMHVIHTIGKNIYINSFPGWGLKEGMKVLRENENYKLKYDNGKVETMFDKLLDDFKIQKKPNINNVDELYLSSYFYDRFKQLGCRTKTNLDSILTLYNKKCGKTSQFCREIYYMYKFLEAQGLKSEKQLLLVNDIAGVSLNWSLSSALILASDKNNIKK